MGCLFVGTSFWHLSNQFSLSSICFLIYSLITKCSNHLTALAFATSNNDIIFNNINCCRFSLPNFFVQHQVLLRYNLIMMLTVHALKEIIFVLISFNKPDARKTLNIKFASVQHCIISHNLGKLLFSFHVIILQNFARFCKFLRYNL